MCLRYFLIFHIFLRWDLDGDEKGNLNIKCHFVVHGSSISNRVLFESKKLSWKKKILGNIFVVCWLDLDKQEMAWLPRDFRYFKRKQDDKSTTNTSLCHFIFACYELFVFENWYSKKGKLWMTRRKQNASKFKLLLLTSPLEGSTKISFWSDDNKMFILEDLLYFISSKLYSITCVQTFFFRFPHTCGACFA